MTALLMWGARQDPQMLSMAVAWLARRNQTIQDNRLDDLREANKTNAELVRETNKAMNSE